MTALPPPPPGRLVRTTRGGTVWHRRSDGDWSSPEYTDPHPWSEVASGRWGDVELLVAVPYTGIPEPTVMEVVEHILNPVAAMMQQLAQAAGAGITAMVAEAERRAAARGYEQGHNVGWSAGYDARDAAPTYEPPPVGTDG